nr:hypothetical protein [Phycisphaeraceae bacterium]
MPELIDQIDAYLDSTLSDEGAAQLHAMISDDPEVARVFAERAILHQQIQSILKRKQIESIQQPRHVLQELLAIEANAD